MRTELLVSRMPGGVLAALREDGITVEMQFEREGEPGSVGSIHKGVVTRVLPGIQSAFVDIGLARDAFLHGGDLAAASEEAAPGRAAGARGSAPGIELRLREGAPLLVQVAREAAGSKGARVTCQISLPGRYLVHLPLSDGRGVSRRIADPLERARLEEILSGVADPGGFIARTAGLGVEEAAFHADAHRLARTWEDIRKRAERAAAPALLHGDADPLIRHLRDAPRRGHDLVVVDDPGDRDRAIAYLRSVDPAWVERVRLHPQGRSLAEAYELDEEISRALRPKVWLRSGGFVVIEPTEALVTIDVNTGKFHGEGEPEATALRINLEAVGEIARQLRLRDLGGIVVIDFVDMERAENRKRVVESLESALKRDRVRTQIVEFGGLGLLLLTRKKSRRGLVPSLTRACPTCGGFGRIRTPDVVAREAIAEADRVASALDGRSITLRAHPDVADEIRRLIGVASAAPTRIRVEEDVCVRPDRFDLVAV